MNPLAIALYRHWSDIIKNIVPSNPDLSLFSINLRLCCDFFCAELIIILNRFWFECVRFLLRPFLVIFSGFCCSGFAIGATDVLVLQSHSSAPYQQTLEGFKANFSERNLAVNYDVHVINNDAELGDIWSQLVAERPQLIVTLGAPSTRATLSREHSIPVVAGLMLNIDELKKNPNATGVGLNFPASLQWLWMRRLLPDARRIALIHDPEHGVALFQALQKLAKAENIILDPVPASNPEDIPELLKNLPNQLDALWVVNGVAAFNSATVQELLLYSFRNRTPLIGLSAQWVKAGAIYALDWDYVDLGKQLGELAGTILQKGVSPSSLVPIEPRKVRPVFNMKTAEYMKLDVANQWLPEMGEVLR